MHFLNKAQKQRADPGQNSGQGKVAESEEEDEKELKSFKAQLRGDGPSPKARRRRWLRVRKSYSLGLRVSSLVQMKRRIKI